MRIAGLGFRQSASTDDLRAALALTGCPRPDALASLTAKAAAPQMQQLAADLNLPVIALSEDEIADTPTLTSSPRIQTRFGTGSLCEAAALVAARNGQPNTSARLIAPRVTTDNGLATAAIAERTTP
ncbi:cobalamin biosynthesis protein [Parasedimentitalea psychrophila]|uniref:Cobalamin biosynthesis protein n=1 Tax=Parasedimentitalea psychrophila TaxID=2997337 RepID=A0A9Y2KYT3_9RHOB|nr:cobalamin biosynthesis protein [Parasedimentitalea psychrophila]WIY25625.1 cobalamin biosynthesis protein [Parasedimentitalea psychrophila]